jgi:dTDP-4-amino-4,6-dideoxygalactose transaminase
MHYPIPIHLQEAYAFLGHSEGDFPVAEQSALSLLSLPMYAELTHEQVDYVAESLRSAVAQAKQ